MYAHGRSLVKKFTGKPFAIVGVNSDANRETVKEVTAKENITWRSFWDGGVIGGPIQSQWNISGFPTMYLIDHRGIIVGKVWPEKDEQLIGQKVTEAEAAKDK